MLDQSRDCALKRLQGFSRVGQPAGGHLSANEVIHGGQSATRLRHDGSQAAQISLPAAARQTVMNRTMSDYAEALLR